MSIEIMFRLVCSTPLCRRPFGEFPQGATDEITVRDFNRLRKEAQAAGWGRFRRLGAVHVGDYCPACCAEISRARTAKQANKKPRADEARGREFA